MTSGFGCAGSMRLAAAVVAGVGGAPLSLGSTRRGVVAASSSRRRAIRIRPFRIEAPRPVGRSARRALDAHLVCTGAGASAEARTPYFARR